MTQLDKLTRKQLYEKAKEKNIKGRSTMTKQQLIDTLISASPEKHVFKYDDLPGDVKGLVMKKMSPKSFASVAATNKANKLAVDKSGQKELMQLKKLAETIVKKAKQIHKKPIKGAMEYDIKFAAWANNTMYVDLEKTQKGLVKYSFHDNDVKGTTDDPEELLNIWLDRYGANLSKEIEILYHKYPAGRFNNGGWRKGDVAQLIRYLNE